MESIEEQTSVEVSTGNEMDKLSRIKEVECSVLKYGLKPIMMEFYFCICDNDQQDPICVACAKECHSGHTLSRMYRGEQICKCGLKNHKYSDIYNLHIQYQPTCYFNEVLDLITNSNYYQAEHDENFKICLFCNYFCDHRDDNDEPIFFEKRSNKVEEELPVCGCTSSSHNDIKHIYSSLNDFIKFMFEKEKIYPIQLINGIFESTDFFRNIYSKFESTFNEPNDDKNSSLLKNRDGTMKYSNLFRSIKNFAKMCESIRNIFYFSKRAKGFFHPTMVCNIIQSKIDINNKYCLKFKYYVMKCFEKITLDEEFHNLPNIKMNDFEYFSPFQRVIIVSAIRFSNEFQANFVTRVNIVNIYLEGLESLLKLSFVDKIDFLLLNTFLKTIKKFAKFYMLEKTQVSKFCDLVQLIFSKSKAFKVSKSDKNEMNKNKQQVIQLKILLNITKILYIYAINHNDKNIIFYLCKDKKENINLFHSQNNIGSTIYMSVINVLNFIRNDLTANLDNEVIKKILVFATKIMSLSLMDNDFYLTGLKRNINENFEKYFDIIKFNYTNFEKNVVLNLSKVSTGLEISYKDNVIRNNVKATSVKNIIIEFFGYIQREDLVKQQLVNHLEGVKKQSVFKYNQNGANMLNHRQRMNEEAYEDIEDIFKKRNKDDNVIRILMMHTNFISNVMKSIDLLSNFDLQSNRDIDYILKLLYFFMYDNCDNAIYCLSSIVFDRLLKVGHIHSNKIFDFVYTCLLIISRSNYEICFSQIIVMKTSTYFFTYNELLEDKGAILMLLKIYHTILYDIDCLNLSDSVELIRKYLNELYKYSDTIKEYKVTLLELAAEQADSISESEVSNRNGMEEREEARVTFTKSTKSKGKLNFNIFVLFLKLVNYSFDEKYVSNEKEFLVDILAPDDIRKILEGNYMLDLGLRSEILKFLRIAYIEVIVVSSKQQEYMASFYDVYERHSKASAALENNRLKKLAFLQKLMKVSSGEVTSSEFEVLLNELTMFQELITAQTNMQSSSIIIDYIENGLFISLRTFLHKFLSFVSQMESHECIKLYLLTVNILKTKLYIFDNTMEIYGHDDFNRQEYVNIETELKQLIQEDFMVLDYSKISAILNNTFLKVVTENKSQSPSEDRFDLLEADYKKRGFLESETEKEMFSIVKEYLKIKDNFESNNVVSNLSQYLIDDNVNYRNLLVKYLFFASQSNALLSNLLSRSSYDIILKILQFDTTRTQEEILRLYRMKHANIINLESMKDLFIIHFTEIAFSSFNPSVITLHDNYSFSCNLIKIFKYLCEEHNNDFQEIMLLKMHYKLRTGIGNVTISFFEFFLLVVEKIIILSGWDEHDKSDLAVSDYFYEMFNNIIEMLIEIVQGTKEEYLQHLLTDYEFEESRKMTGMKDETVKVLPNFIKFIKRVIIKDNWNRQLMFNVKRNLAELVLTFLEEKNTPVGIKKLITNHFHPKVLSECICSAFKKYYDDRTHATEPQTNNPLQYKKTFRDQCFDEKMLSFFKETYYKDLEFNTTPEFTYCNTLYHIVKILELYQQSGESQQFFLNVKEINDNEALKSTEHYSKHDKQFLEICTVIRFFEKITATIRIQLDNGDIINTVYTKNPRIPFLSSNTKKSFIENVNRDSRNSKLLDLIENCYIFKEEIVYNYHKSTDSQLFHWLNKINYKLVIYLMFAITLSENLLMLATYEIDHFPSEIELILFIMSISELCSYTLIFSVWTYTKLPLYLKLEIKEIERAAEQDNEFLMPSKVAIVGRIIKKKNETLSLVWNIVFCFLSTVLSGLRILYAFKLLIMLELNETLRNIRHSIEYRARPLLITISFMVILCYTFAVYAFYSFNEDFFDFDVYS